MAGGHALQIRRIWNTRLFFQIRIMKPFARHSLFYSVFYVAVGLLGTEAIQCVLAVEKLAAEPSSAVKQLDLGWPREIATSTGSHFEYLQTAADADDANPRYNYSKAREYLRKAADAGQVDAMYTLGSFYAKGRGGAQDYGKAREWYQKAADAGLPDAMYILGLFYAEGWGGAQDYAKAREWYQKAADAGHADAMYG